MKKRIMKIYGIHKPKVQVHCSEFHAHSAKQGCLVGDKNSIDICILCEEILALEYRLTKILSIALKED